MFGQYVYGKLTDTNPFPVTPVRKTGEFRLPPFERVVAWLRRAGTSAAQWVQARMGRGEAAG
jgi:hypothetical protein